MSPLKRTRLIMGTLSIVVGWFASPAVLLCAIAQAAWGQNLALTQEECVRMALRQNPQVRAAQADRDVARVEADRNRPVARPTLNATASGTLQGPRVQFPRPLGTEATFLPEQAGRLDLVLEQPLYRAGLGAARARYAAESAAVDVNYLKSLWDLALTVRKAYVEALRAEAGVGAAQAGLDAAQRYQELVSHQIAAGVARPVDAETARAQVAEARAGVQKADGGLQLARYNLNRIIGRPQETALNLMTIAASPSVPDHPDEAIDMALRMRPELQALEQNLRAAQAGISLARVEAQPSLGLRGQLSEQTPTALLHEHYAAATLELRWSLLDGGKVRQDVREARAQTERLKALRDDSRAGIALEVRTAWQHMVDAQAQILSAREQREGLERTATVAAKAYEVGQGSVVQVKEAQHEVRSAREREVNALYDLYDANLDFIHAQGLDLPDLPNPPSLPHKVKR